MESLRVAVNDWLISNQWQGRTGNNVGTNAGTRVLLLASQASAAPGVNPRDVVKISAAFTYLTVSGTWNKPLGILQNASISLAVSGLGPATLLSGVDIPFYDIESGRVDTYYIRIPADTHQPARVEGQFKFVFQTDDATKSTEATVLYWFSSPYTGPSPAVDSQKGVSLFPTTVAAKYQSDSGYIIDVEEKVPTPATHIRPAETSTTHGIGIHPVLRQGGESQMNLLLIKYLDDNGRNPSPGMYTMLLGYLREQYTMALYFNSGMLELFGSIDPTTMYMAADFYVRFPVARRIKLYNLRGSLLDGQAIQATVSEFVGGGTASFKAVKNTTGKYDLICSLYLKITLVAPEGISLNEQKILELPF
ncbi:hypothetical protein H1R20_g4160, partial [Candolleomyces eurysporus]